MNEEDARRLLDHKLAAVGCGPASTWSTGNHACKDRLREAWWSQNMKPERSEVPRKIGYMRGYIRIAGDGLLVAGGLPLDDGIFLWMDRAVLKCMERDGYLCWRSGETPHFEITPKGAVLFGS